MYLLLPFTNSEDLSARIKVDASAAVKKTSTSQLLPNAAVIVATPWQPRLSVPHTAHKHQATSNKNNSCTKVKTMHILPYTLFSNKLHGYDYTRWWRVGTPQVAAGPWVRLHRVVMVEPRWGGLDGRVLAGGPTTLIMWLLTTATKDSSFSGHPSGWWLVPSYWSSFLWR